MTTDQQRYNLPRGYRFLREYIEDLMFSPCYLEETLEPEPRCILCADVIDLEHEGPLCNDCEEEGGHE